jgi:3-phosphoinositide dependent protein kinase-1
MEGSATPPPKKKTTAVDFEFLEVLGNGAFGEVSCRCNAIYIDIYLSKVKRVRLISTGKEFAAKMLNKKHIIESGNSKYVHTERDVFNKCSHPNIVKLYYTFQDPKTLCILFAFEKKVLYSLTACEDYVLELCSNGSLASHLKRVSAN